MTRSSGTIHVGIVTYNSIADIDQCLGGVEGQSDVDLRVHILDNGSVDGTREWLYQHSGDADLIMSARNLGFGSGHNRIIEELHIDPGDWYMTLNPDVRLLPNYVGRLRDALATEGAGWGTGKLRLMGPDDTDLGKIYSVGHALLRNGYPFNIGFGMVDEGQFEDRREVFGAPGAAAMMSAAFVEALSVHGGLFDDRMFLYGEDIDLDWRAQRAGWTCLYEPQAIALHRGSTASRELQAQAISNRYISVIKNADPWDLIAFNIPFALLHILVRLLISPASGWTIFRQVAASMRSVGGKRSSRLVPRSRMRRWFSWSQEQPTAQPRSIVERALALARRVLRDR